ncbi:HWE histidine kinase domain-containing protein [Roseivivax sp. CAU 1761]
MRPETTAAREAARHDAADLTECDREPIHLLGRVQSYGALIAVSSDWIVQHASQNLGEVLGTGGSDPIGQPLSRLLPDTAMRLIRDRMHQLGQSAPMTRIFGFTLGARRFDVSIHQSGRHLVLEFEPKTQTRDGDALAQTWPLIQRVRDAHSIEVAAQEGARALQALSGFDSVMVYQFQPDLSGRVIAQSRIGRTPNYLGLRFPASDIPAQARELYTRSLLRLIADATDPGVPILPDRAPEGTPLDLSLAITRAVSPVHLEYLRNMDVAASMSVSIMKDGVLWGLFACHHRTPRHIEFETRTTIELFAHLFSYELSRIEEASREEVEAAVHKVQTKLLRQVVQGRSFADLLPQASSALQEVLPHDGLVLHSEGRFTAVGQTPDEDEFAALIRYLNRTESRIPFATDALAQDHPEAAAYLDRTAGILVVPVPRDPRDYLVFCRQEQARSVDWAGEPAKAASEDGARISPRKSFKAWREIVAGRSAPWTPNDFRSAELMRTMLLEVFLRAADAARAEQARSRDRQDLLIGELNHRVRNILNLMRGLVAQTRHTESRVEDFAGSLDGRIQSLARAHDQLTRRDWRPGSLHELLQIEFAAYAGAEDRVEIRGHDVLVAPDAYTTLALVLHEMVTNSVKRGALSRPEGRIAVDLARDGAGGLAIAWGERGGPQVAAPERRGFGSAVIERSIPHELGGAAEIEYRAEGVQARFGVPARFLTEPENVVALQRVKPAAPAGRPRLSGTALVVEDAMIVAMDAADMLTEFGADDVRIAGSVAEALRVLESAAFDVAFVDVNLGGERSVAVAEALVAAGIPFVLVTGYGESEELRRAYPPCPIVQKPFSSDTMAVALVEAGLLSSDAAPPAARG